MIDHCCSAMTRLTLDRWPYNTTFVRVRRTCNFLALATGVGAWGKHGKKGRGRTVGFPLLLPVFVWVASSWTPLEWRWLRVEKTSAFAVVSTYTTRLW